MTCKWQHPASKNGETARVCGKEGHPFCNEHQFIVDVLEETESVAREICQQRETAATVWQAQLLRFRLLVAQGDELTPAAFVKRVHELLPELHEAATAAVVYTYLTSERGADVKTYDNQGKLRSEINTTYTQVGSVITTNTVYNSNGQVISQHVSIRDSSGKVTTKNTFGGKLLP